MIFNNFFERRKIRKMSTSDILEEISQMCQAYIKRYPHARVGFLVGSSLVGNKKGDRDRYWKLKDELKARGVQN